MFYFYLTIAYYCFLSLMAQLLIMKMGYIGILGSFTVNLFFTFIFVALALRKFKLPHEHSHLLYMIGAWISVFGIVTLFLRENYLNVFTFCFALLSANIFTSYGLIIMLYNKVGECKDKIEKQVETDESRTNLIYSVIFSIDDLFRNPRIQLNREFATRLYNCQVYLSELERIKYPVKKALLEQIIDVLYTYRNLKETLLPTQHCWETIQKIEESFIQIEQALANMYNSYSDSQLEEASIKTEVLVNYLNLNGYLENKMTEENKIEQ